MNRHGALLGAIQKSDDHRCQTIYKVNLVLASRDDKVKDSTALINWLTTTLAHSIKSSDYSRNVDALNFGRHLVSSCLRTNTRRRTPKVKGATTDREREGAVLFQRFTFDFYSYSLQVQIFVYDRIFVGFPPSGPSFWYVWPSKFADYLQRTCARE